MRRVDKVVVPALCAVVLALAGCGLLSPHTVSTPNIPDAPTSGPAGERLAFDVEGAMCSHGHSIEYRFDWDDGTYSAWSAATSVSHSWDTEGTYVVKAQARCAADASVVSSWSAARSVTVTAVGATRDNGYLAITVQGVRTASEIRLARAARGYVFLIVEIKGRALQDVVHLVAEWFTVVQADGQEHKLSGATVALGPDRLDTRTNMYAGDYTSGELAFEVCASQEHYTLEYRPGRGEHIAFTFYP